MKLFHGFGQQMIRHILIPFMIILVEPAHALKSIEGEGPDTDSIEIIENLKDELPDKQTEDNTPKQSLTVTWKSGTEVETDVSGDSSGVGASDMEGAIFHKVGMFGISWLEKENIPCEFYTKVRKLDSGEIFGEQRNGNSSYNFGECGVGIVSNRKTAEFRGNPRYFVRGLQVCDSKHKGNKRVKGIRLFGVKVWKTKAELEILSSHVEAVHNNCGKWKNAVYCPKGFVAHGLAYYRVSVIGGVTGIALRCSQIVWN